MTLNLDKALLALSRDPSAPIDLAEIALLLARDEFANLDVEAHLNELDAMAYEVQPYLRGHLAHQVQGLCRYVFHEMGFRGNPRDYYDPRNSYFNQVLERRMGIPITLSAVVMAIGQRVGMQIEGIGLPGHFVVLARSPREEILIDPYHGGRILTHQDCQILVEQVTGASVEASALRLDPLPIGLIVLRMLGNLKSIYLRAQDWTRSARIIERLRQISPHDVQLRRDLGICQVRRSHPGKAIDHLRAYLDSEPEADDADSIRLLLRGAVNAVAQWN